MKQNGSTEKIIKFNAKFDNSFVWQVVEMLAVSPHFHISFFQNVSWTNTVNKNAPPLGITHLDRLIRSGITSDKLTTMPPLRADDVQYPEAYTEIDRQIQTRRHLPIEEC
jgi:hypothetical protein